MSSIPDENPKQAEVPDDPEHRREQTSLYGGQAIIEGVMMKGPERTVAAVRNPEGIIVHKILREGQDEQKRNFWYKAPFLRGFLILIDSLSVGYQALMFSGEVADPEGKPRNPLIENTMIIISLIIALSIFKFIPVVLAKWILGSTPGQAEATGGDLLGFSVLWSFVEGIIKAGVLVGYILSIRLMGDVRRVFQYHGAEHKTINAYEGGSDLSLDDVMKYPTFHPRCGTSFLFAVILFSLIFAMMFPLITWWLFGDPLKAMHIGIRFGLHIFFLPIIAAFGYEFIRMTAKLSPHSTFMRILTYPGRLFQMITALEPDRDMVEVALVSMHLAMGLKFPEALKASASAYKPPGSDSPESSEGKIEPDEILV
jgi:uncharacterized protein YqhQ